MRKHGTLLVRRGDDSPLIYIMWSESDPKKVVDGLSVLTNYFRTRRPL
jgi:hypothetical protein